jgi:phosphoribosylformylglycinamidine synthase
MPDELFVKAPIFGKPYGVGCANSVNQFYGDIDPAIFGRLMLASAATKLVAAGFAPSDLVFCANVYSPPATDDPEAAWCLEQLVKYGYAPGTEEIGIPVISGKDSSSGRFKNEQTGQKTNAPLTLDILSVGRMPDVSKLIRKPFVKPGDQIVLYTPGLIKMALGGSVLNDLFGQRGDRLPQVDLKRLRQGLEAYYAASPHITSRSAIAEGGLMRRLFECCFGGNLGCNITIPSAYYQLEFLFAELHGSILFTANGHEWQILLTPEFHILGEVVKEPTITVSYHNHSLFSASIADLGRYWSRTFSEVIA